MKRALISILFAAATVTAQEPAQPGRYLGVATCVNAGCHGSTQPLNTTRVLQNEYYTWLNHDRHSGAYTILFSERSARIARNMRIRAKAYESDVCLDCHTTNLPARLVEGHVDKEDGVQCEVCHGPASGWRAEHTEEGWTREQSVARGMIDLRAITNRASVCAGCHIGNAKKEVDHELIAAGHPVLRFELDNFTATMPPHWTPNRDTHGVRAWAVGQAVKFRESLDNVARHARGDEWPEFSDMSCHHCHHALKDSGWRQERGWPDRAGLPSWSPQHWAMLRLLIGRVSPEAREQLDPLVAQLARGVARMNDPNGVAATADKARRIVEPLVARIEARTWSDADVRAMMTAVASDGALSTADVHAAQQAAFALQSLASVLTRRDARLLKGPMMQSIDALFDEVEDEDAFEPRRFTEKLARVKAALQSG